MKWENDKFEIIGVCLPPCGGSGLKSSASCSMEMFLLSPSMRREWIEIPSRRTVSVCLPRLPPCGGSGLKSAHPGWNELGCSLPPCGGSGLKWILRRRRTYSNRSPSMRREWIEIVITGLCLVVVPCLPPCGGSGLKSLTGCGCTSCLRLPPCGGSGLKCNRTMCCE